MRDLTPDTTPAPGATPTAASDTTPGTVPDPTADPTADPAADPAADPTPDTVSIPAPRAAPDDTGPAVREPGWTAGASVTELVAAARRRDRAAWTELMARYGGLVRSVAHAHRLQDADAADAEQNTWMRAVERLHTVREPEKLGGWLRTTARRECLSVLAAAGRERVDAAAGEALIEPAPGPEAVVLQDEMRCTVRTALDGLTGRRRTLVDVLFFGWPGNYAAASQLIGMPVGSIGPTRARTLHDLRLRLEDVGYGLDCGWDGRAGEPGAGGKVGPGAVATAPVGLPAGAPAAQPPASGSNARISCVRERMPSLR